MRDPVVHVHVHVHVHLRLHLRVLFRTCVACAACPSHMNIIFLPLPSLKHSASDNQTTSICTIQSHNWPSPEPNAFLRARPQNCLKCRRPGCPFNRPSVLETFHSSADSGVHQAVGRRPYYLRCRARLSPHFTRKHRHQLFTSASKTGVRRVTPPRLHLDTSTTHSPATPPSWDVLIAKRVALFADSIGRGLVPLSQSHSHLLILSLSLSLETNRVPDREVLDRVPHTATDIGLRNAEAPRTL